MIENRKTTKEILKENIGKVSRVSLYLIKKL